jgi:phosphatidate cytidylyltransferase
MLVPSLPFLWTVGCLFGTLTLGTLVRVWMLHGVSVETAQSHLNSIKSWWALSLVLVVALFIGDVGVAVLMGSVGILSLREFLKIVGWQRIGAPTTWAVFALAFGYYALLLCGYEEWLRSSAPFAFVLAVGTIRASLGLIEDYIRITSAMIWGLMLFVFCLSHTYFLLKLPDIPEPWFGRAGWFLYLVLLTECNDIAQALIGRRFGQTKIVPRISPKKSLEGFLGGLSVTMILAVILAPWLTSLMTERSWSRGILATLLSGVLISVLGFLGDINKSGIKRDVGVKDSGTLLPGQGGMMDRVDSLTFSAPGLYFFVQSILPYF